MKSIETQLYEAREITVQLMQFNKALKDSFKKAQRRAAKAERELLFYKSNLKQESKDRLHQAFRESTDNAGLKEAINTEMKRG